MELWNLAFFKFGSNWVRKRKITYKDVSEDRRNGAKDIETTEKLVFVYLRKGLHLLPVKISQLFICQQNLV